MPGSLSGHGQARLACGPGMAVRPVAQSFRVIWQRWDDLAARLANVLESPDPESAVRDSGDPDLAELFDCHRRAGNFLESPAPAPRHALLGRLIRGRYRLESVLGRGGAGVVFRACDEQLAARPVVIKLLHDFWATEDWMRRRFREEAALLAGLDHPGVVSLIDSGETEDGRLFLVLPFREGRTLREAIAAGPLDLLIAARLLREMGEAVHYAHQRGILHRDLKPENVLLVLRPDGEHAMLIDFGIAHTGEAGRPSETTTHLMGSAAYMAPEHLMGKASMASDTYSLAVIAWEMLSGTRPFDSLTPFALPELQRRGPGDDFYRLRPDLPTGIGKLLASALTFDPARRPQPVTAFTGELAKALMAGAVDSPLVRIWAIRRSRRWILAGGATVVVASGAGGWWLRDRLVPLPAHERVIEFPAGYTAEMAGFSIHREVTERAIRDFQVRGAVTAIRLFSADQGQLHKPLTRRQKEQAFRNGWKVAALVRPETGYVAVAVESGQFARRFDTGFEVTSGGVQLIATERIRQGWDGIRAAVTLPPAPAMVRLEMRYDAARKTADVSVDGKTFIRGYSGHLEYRDDLGVYLGVGSLDGSVASSVFGGLRFEILSGDTA